MDIEKIFNSDYFLLQDSLKEIYLNIKKVEKEASVVLQAFKDKKENLIQDAKKLIADYENNTKNQASK